MSKIRNKMAKYLIPFFLALFAAQASAVFWDDLRVTFGPGIEAPFFTRLPRVVTDAVREGWGTLSPTCENNGTVFGFRYKQPGEDNIHVLFDKNGVIAGVQALLPHEEIMNENNTFRYDLVPMFQNETINGKMYVVLTAYFVPPESICTVGRTPMDLILDGTGSGLWFQNGASPNAQIDVPMTRPEASAVGWTDCECFPGMGLHNFWQVETWAESNCNLIQPTQVTFNHDLEMTGFIFQISGPTNSSRFEHPPNEALIAIIGPSRIPQCIIDSNTAFGSATIHFYMIDEPWTLSC